MHLAHEIRLEALDAIRQHRKLPLVRCASNTAATAAATAATAATATTTATATARCRCGRCRLAKANV